MQRLAMERHLRYEIERNQARVNTTLDWAAHWQIFFFRGLYSARRPQLRYILHASKKKKKKKKNPGFSYNVEKKR
jgi:hypothetical protein